jgi:hypothetical protein
LVRCAVAAPKHVLAGGAEFRAATEISFRCGPPTHNPIGLFIRLSNLIQTVVPRPARPSVSDGIKDTLSPSLLPVSAPLRRGFFRAVPPNTADAVRNFALPPWSEQADTDGGSVSV